MSKVNWKKAQEKVKKEFKKFEKTTKKFFFGEFADTYQAQGNFIQEQPSDMWALYEAQFIFIEIKSNEQNRFPMKDIQPSQIAGAMRALAAGGFYIFLICKIPEWQWHYLDGKDVIDAVRNDKKSFGWDEMTPINLKAEEILP